jgi:DNA-3-methyladenine glycosylase
VPARDLCRGPGNLTKAMGIGLAENRADLTSPGSGASRLWIEDRGILPGPIAWSSRVGIRVGTEHQWRCLVADHPCVSRG